MSISYAAKSEPCVPMQTHGGLAISAADRHYCSLGAAVIVYPPQAAARQPVWGADDSLLQPSHGRPSRRVLELCGLVGSGRY